MSRLLRTCHSGRERDEGLRLVDIILPLAIRDVYTYSVPDEIVYPQQGMRVLVPLGRKKITGIVLGPHTEPMDEKIRVRPIESVLDTYPIVTEEQIRLWQWMARYYMCTIGEVMNAALPSGIIDDDYTARTEVYVQLHPHICMERAQACVARARKQAAVLDTYARLAPQGERIARRLLIEESGESTAIVRALEEKGILARIEEEVGRIAPYTGPIEAPHTLTPAQQRAVEEIEESRSEHAVSLLYGVTSSGKTEVYIHLIEAEMKQGRSCLYLVPEIALTTQLTERLRRVFGSRLMVYHSRMRDVERVEIYRAIRTATEPIVVIGARSAVLLPLQTPGLIIVDEEHEQSYKQAEPAPRYNARSVAIMWGRACGAHVLLGTATPSIESYYHARQGKYGLVRLTERHQGISLPAIRLIDLERQYHRREMYGHLSDPLVEKIQQVLERGKQVILFQNRRGYAPMVQCTQCGDVPHCVQCDVAMTLHMQSHELRCHWCGHSIAQPQVCPKCGGEMKVRGLGTERLEDEVQALFPQARVLRMDLDTTRTKTGYQDIINAFSRHECDILIGTQMVTKGLHFDDVALVAVLQADQVLNQPDFRSWERAYQMLEQVAGRAGRKGEQGEVLIQSYDAEHTVLQLVQAHDYEALYEAQIAERQLYRYPPYYRIIQLTLKHRYPDRVGYAAMCMQARLQQIFGARISSVITPGVSRVQNQHIRQLTLRIEQGANLQEAKRRLQETIDYVQQVAKGTTIIADTDPM